MFTPPSGAQSGFRPRSRSRLAAGTRVAAAATLTVLALTATGLSSRTVSLAAAAQAPTVVTLTFDDGWADQYQGLAMLNAHGMHATYFLNSPRISGDSAYMTWSNVADLAAAGNEIGGHTAYHADLPFIDPTEAQRQICYDRDNLLQRGYNVTNFAFPYGDFSPAVKTMVQNCGYNSARTTDDIPAGESVRADSAARVPTRSTSAPTTTTLTSMENAVTAARQNGGGWVPIVFHHICNGCNVNSITASDFNTFLNWLQGQAANNVVVKTMQEVIGGATQPQVPGPGLPPAPNGTNALRNSSLEQERTATAFRTVGRTTTSATTTSPGRARATRTPAPRGETERHELHRRRQQAVVLPDLGYCMPSVNQGHRYRITEWYKSTHRSTSPCSAVTPMASQLPDRSDSFPASSTWTQASFVTDLIPNGINGLSFGLTLGSNGRLPSTTRASTTLPGRAARHDAADRVAELADGELDRVGVRPDRGERQRQRRRRPVDYLIDGAVTATLTSGPFTYSWNSRAVANGAHTIAVARPTIRQQDHHQLRSPSSSEPEQQPPPEPLARAGRHQPAQLLAARRLQGTNTVSWAWTADAHSGTHGENLNIASWTNGDRKLLTGFSSACSPAVIPATPTRSAAGTSRAVGPVFMAF